jgi:transposase
MLKVADVHVLRHLVLAEGVSQREVARRFGISRNTVARYVDQNVIPGVRVQSPRPKPAQDAIRAKVDRIVDTSRVTKKQRLTAERVVELLAEDGVEASVRTVRRLMREHRRRKAEVYVPLEYVAGDLAEVDFFEVVVHVDGRDQKAFLFVMRLMHSGRDYVRLYRWQDQAAFLDGHVRAFAHFGCVPRRILYDNLRAAVRRFVGSERELTVAFGALAAHYAFGCRFARPRTGHDKGGVESRGKAVRWQHLTPIPAGASLDEISDRVLARIDARLDRPRRRGGPRISALWEEDKAEMLPLPAHAHDAGILLEDVPADRQAQIRVRTARYSVPSHWHDQLVKVRLYADRVVAVLGKETVEHVRQPANGKSIWYPHYLTELAKKPAAVEQVGDRLFAQLGDGFDRLWRRLVDHRGRQAAARSMKPVLQSILAKDVPTVHAAIERALQSDRDPILALTIPKPEKVGVVLPERLAQAQVESTPLAVYRGLGGVR